MVKEIKRTIFEYSELQ